MNKKFAALFLCSAVTGTVGPAFAQVGGEAGRDVRMVLVNGCIEFTNLSADRRIEARYGAYILNLQVGQTIALKDQLGRCITSAFGGGITASYLDPIRPTPTPTPTYTPTPTPRPTPTPSPSPTSSTTVQPSRVGRGITVQQNCSHSVGVVVFWVKPDGTSLGGTFPLAPGTRPLVEGNAREGFRDTSSVGTPEVGVVEGDAEVVEWNKSNQWKRVFANGAYHYITGTSPSLTSDGRYLITVRCRAAR